MTYSRKKLNSLKLNTKEYDDIVQNLFDKVYAHEEISLAEQHLICRIVEMLRNDKNQKAYKIEDFPSCSDYEFRNKYLIYHRDLNGHNKVVDSDGEVGINQKKKDVEYLQKTYENWENHLKSKMNGTSIINYVAQETHHQIKKLNEYCSNFSIGSNFKNYKKKSIVLHGKFIYLLVKEYFQELNSDKIEIKINGNTILIDAFTYVHTMFRHYAAGIKDHQQDKTYHFDGNIGYKSIPDFLLDIVKCYAENYNVLNFNSKNIYLKFNNSFYAIWLRPFKKSLKGKITKKYLRVQTFYPVESEKELAKLENAKERTFDCGFTFIE